METLTKIIEALGAKLIEAERLLMEINVLLFDIGRGWAAQFIAMSACGVLIGALVGYVTIVSVLLRQHVGAIVRRMRIWEYTLGG